VLWSTTHCAPDGTLWSAISYGRTVGQVSFVRGLYAQFRHLIRELAAFGIVGAAGFVVTFGGTAILHEKLGMGFFLATVVATVVATAVTYVGNRYWTFRHRERTSVPRESAVFLVLNGVGIVIQEAVVLFGTHVLGVRGGAQYIALFVGVVLGTLFRFWSYRKWVWPAASPAPPDVRLAAGPSSGPPSTGLGDLEPATMPPGSLRQGPAGYSGRHAAGRSR
jgi:putative flippase GtrA